jgi:hypothetical protein
MPYLIHIPPSGPPFITNNPLIYMDALFWGWPCSSHSPHSQTMKDMMNREERLGRREYRENILEQIWETEVDRRRRIKGLEKDVAEIEAAGTEANEREHELGGRGDVGGAIEGGVGNETESRVRCSTSCLAARLDGYISRSRRARHPLGNEAPAH